MEQIPENVKYFMRETARMYGEYTRKLLYNQMRNFVSKCNSPIEVMYGSAMFALLRASRHEVSFAPLFDDFWLYSGVKIEPQKEIGAYKVDFLLSSSGFVIFNKAEGDPAELNNPRKVIVELDGHKFHETTPAQRKYEKERDRFFQKEGYKVLHYTGSEIVKNPFSAALESLSAVTGIDWDEINFWFLNNGDVDRWMDFAFIREEVNNGK